MRRHNLFREDEMISMLAGFVEKSREEVIVSSSYSKRPGPSNVLPKVRMELRLVTKHKLVGNRLELDYTRFLVYKWDEDDLADNGKPACQTIYEGDDFDRACQEYSFC